MNSIPAKSKPKDFLIILLLFQLTIYTLVLFDIPVARQTVGFVYLIFVPGFAITKLLKLDNLDKLETVLFSVGLSIAFLMLAGLFINALGFLVGITQPLSQMPLLIVLNSVVLIFGILAYLRSEGTRLLWSKTLAISPLSLLLVILPVLTVVGAMWVNVYNNNSILLLMLIVLSLLFSMGLISRKLPAGFYAIAIFVIAISLLYHSSLISKYLVSFGSDNPLEYFVFKTTENNAHWSSIGSSLGRFNSMLSVTILPTIYSILLNVDATNVFKILYPLIFAFVPLALYKLWQPNFGTKRAFAAAFLLVAQSTFYMEMLGLNRQIVAELFFVLLLFVLSTKIKGSNKLVCFVIFSFALITSHYALAEIFLFFVAIAWVFLAMRKRISRNLTVAFVVLFFVMMFFWYIYTSGSATFNDIVNFGNYVYEQLGQFLDPASRGTTVLTGLGLGSSPSIWNTVGRVFAYITEFFIVVGFIGLITKRKSIQFKNEYFTFTVLALGLLVALIAVPGLANTMNMSRFYHILLFFLAPLCVLGAETLVKLISKRRTELYASLLLVIVLVPYLLFQTNFVYEVVGVQSSSLPLSKHRMDATFLRSRLGYFDESEIIGALWVSKNVDVHSSKLYADLGSAAGLLDGYGMMGLQVEILSNTTAVSAKATIYLNRANLVDEIFAGPMYLWNTTDISPILDLANKVYSNGGCEIYEQNISP